jgi:hypothetical protein
MPAVNVAPATRDLVSRPAGVLGQRTANRKICCLRRRDAQQIVWPIASFSDLSGYNFENLQMI